MEMTHSLRTNRLLDKVVGPGLCDEVGGEREQACSRREPGSFEKLGKGHPVAQA